MTLDQLLNENVSAENLRNLWLVFDELIAQRLKDVQPNYQHQVAPIALADGRYTVCADLLGEKDRLYAPTFQALDSSAFSSVDVVSKAEIITLFPIANNDD